MIHKSWERTARRVGAGLAEHFGTEDKYVDSDGFLWTHRHGQQGSPDELIAYDENGDESLVVTLETFK